MIPRIGSGKPACLCIRIPRSITEIEGFVLSLEWPFQERIQKDAQEGIMSANLISEPRIAYDSHWTRARISASIALKTLA